MNIPSPLQSLDPGPSDLLKNLISLHTYKNERKKDAAVGILLTSVKHF